MARASSTNSTLSVDTITSFNAHFKAFSDAIKQVLTQTADSGQVNWTTNPTRGPVYEVYRFNDTLQATVPIFIRLDYNTGAGTPNQPLYYVTLGTGSNGAGTITGVLLAVTQFNTGLGGDSAAVYSNYVSNGDGSLLTTVQGVNPNITTASSWWGLTIERFRNPDGSANADGVNIWIFAPSYPAGYNASRVFNTTNGQPAVEFGPPVFLPYGNNATTYFTGGTEYAFPFNTWGPVNPAVGLQPIAWRGASQAMMYGLTVDYPRLVPINITHYGRSMQFLALGSAATSGLPVMTNATVAAMRYAYCPLVRWE